MSEKNEDTLFVGFEIGTGKEVRIPIFHSLVAGQTQMSGKTTLMKTLAKQAVEQGYKILVFDTKQNKTDFDTFGEEIPICLRETTDSLTILGLLESIMGRKLSQQYATLTRCADGAKNFQEVLSNATDLESESRPGFVKDAAKVLIDLMQRLIEQTKDRETTAKLELKHPINRITMNKFALEGQQMIVKTAFEDALEFEKLIVLLDESSKFLPQKYRSACGRAINHFVTQGAVSGDFLWMSTQFLATTSKEQMKAMDVKILGRQSHDTECEHTLDLIPKTGGQKWTNDSIMQLKLGHFVVVAENWVKTVYTVPEYADKRECLEVALGKREPKNIHYRYTDLLTSEEVQKLQKTLRQTEVIQIEAPPEAESPQPKEMPIKFRVTETVNAKPKPVEPILHTDGSYRVPKKPVEEPKRRRKPAFTGKPFGGPLGERIELLENNMEGIRLRVIDLEKVIDGGMQNFRSEIDKWVQHVQDQKITLEQSHTQIKLEKVIKQVKINDEIIRGKILTLAKEHFFGIEPPGTRLTDAVKLWKPLREIVDELEKHGWTVKPISVKMELLKMVEDQIIGSKKAPNKELLYTLAPNVEFV